MTFSKASKPAALAKVVEIEDVDRQIANGFRMMRFETALERSYEDDLHADRMRFSAYSTVIGVLIYNAFLVSDFTMIPDVFVECCIYRLGIFTPLALLIYFVGRPYCMARRRYYEQVREGCWAVVSVLSVFAIMKCIADSSSRYVPVYSYGTVLVMIFSIVVQRPPIRYAMAVCFAIFAVQMTAVTHSVAFDERIVKANILFFVSASILLLSVAYILELEKRRGYLFALRGRLLNANLEAMAKIDPLTGLWNRRYLNAKMAEAWTEAASSPKSMAVILVDIDHFKRFNDAYGHLEGDICLQRVGDCMRRVLHCGRDIAVRFGGEEFLIFVSDFDIGDARAVAENFRDVLRAEAIPHPVLGANAIVTASVGGAVGLAPAMAPGSLIAAADQALYDAKNRGRDRIRFAGADTGVGEIIQPYPAAVSA